MVNDLDNRKRRFVFLVQHGQAVPKEQDPDRPLTEAGRRTVEQVADWAARAALPVGRVQHSGKLRAQQTAEILAERLDPEEGTVVDERMAPTGDVTPVAEMLDECRSVMLVGHLPFLSRLAGLLVAGDADREVVQFQNGGIVGLVRTDDAWKVWCAVRPELI
jgi:phosphohistidine phosphatase